MRFALPHDPVSSTASIAAGVVAVGLIGLVDYSSGPVAMSLLYFMPIVAVAWLSTSAASLIVALSAGGAWLASELAITAYATEIIFWNAFTRTATFVILAVMVRIVRRDRDKLDALNTKLNEALQIEARAARTDPLTALPNARSFREALDRELARSQREGAPMGVAYVDLDNFKRINDALGHEAGDQVLRGVGDALRRSVRTEDLPARLGGDEFAILCINPSETGLQSIAERVIAEMAEIARGHEGYGLGCTIGMVLFESSPSDATAAVREADALMYETKERAKGGFEVRVIRNTDRKV